PSAETAAAPNSAAIPAAGAGSSGRTLVVRRVAENMPYRNAGSGIRFPSASGTRVRSSARRRRMQVATLDHRLQRVVADRQRQIDAPTAAGFVAGEDDLRRVQRSARALPGLA